MNLHPILYSFRRCPYAMRARMGLHQAKIRYEHREIILRDKPTHMLEISPKGTVPILQLTDGTVIDESLDIISWALTQHDPDNWLNHNKTLIAQNDSTFKTALDRYKYPNRYPEEDCSNARDNGLKILENLNQIIKQNGALHGAQTTLTDIAIFPFIRQFAHVDRDWFYALPLPDLQKWLQTHLESALFTDIMKKYDLWTPNLDKTYIN